MNLYIFVGATTLLKEESAEFYIGTAWEHFSKSNQGFRKAEKEAKQQNAKVSKAGTKVAGNENSNISDIVSRVESKMREWQPNLRKFNFDVNHFYVGGKGIIQSTNQAFKWVVIFHFE